MSIIYTNTLHSKKFNRIFDSSKVDFESIEFLEISSAGVTQLVEYLLPKQNVAGPSPVTRSTNH